MQREREAAEEYEVEAIVARRKRGRGWQLLVKWSGWPLDTTDGWEPRGRLAKCEALDKFEEQHGVEGASSLSCDGPYI